MSFKSIIAAPILAAGVAAAATPASALTAVAIPNTSGAPAVELVSGGCGVYAHRTVYGYCRPNIVRYGYRPLPAVRLVVRPYGWHRAYGWHRWYGWHRGW